MPKLMDTNVSRRTEKQDIENALIEAAIAAIQTLSGVRRIFYD